MTPLTNLQILNGLSNPCFEVMLRVEEKEEDDKVYVQYKDHFKIIRRFLKCLNVNVSLNTPSQLVEQIKEMTQTPKYAHSANGTLTFTSYVMYPYRYI